MPVIISLIVPAILVIGSWFTIQSDLRHLEFRLTADEQQISRDITNLEQRVHAVELDSQSRLASIETKMDLLQVYIMRIDELLRANDDNNRTTNNRAGSAQ